jgi:hypothetical protein
MDAKDKKIKELEEEIGAYKINGAVGLYYELNRLVNETVKYTRNTSISSLLTDGEKGDKKFERTMALIKNAKEHVSDMVDIKNKLKLSGDEKKDMEDMPFIETVAEPRK